MNASEIARQLAQRARRRASALLDDARSGGATSLIEGARERAAAASSALWLRPAAAQLSSSVAALGHRLVALDEAAAELHRLVSAASGDNDQALLLDLLRHSPLLDGSLPEWLAPLLEGGHGSVSPEATRWARHSLLRLLCSLAPRLDLRATPPGEDVSDDDAWRWVCSHVLDAEDTALAAALAPDAPPEAVERLVFVSYTLFLQSHLLTRVSDLALRLVAPANPPTTSSLLEAARRHVR